MSKWLVAFVVICLAAGTALFLSQRQPTSTQTASQPVGAPLSTLQAARPVAASSSGSSITANSTAAEPSVLPQSTPGIAASTAVSAKPKLSHSELGELGAAAPTSLPAGTVLENMRSAIRDFGSMFGGHPVGTNEEITRALNGENPKQAKFLRSEAGMRLNEKGELIDPWGTPFFFHQLSGTQMEIRSAGPDRKMWTADDLVTK